MHCCANWWQFSVQFPKRVTRHQKNIEGRHCWKKNKKEFTCNLPNTPGEIVSFLITLAIRALSHAFDRIAQLLTGMSCTSASRYSICTRPKQKKRPSLVIVMRISANYNCTERTGTDGKKWSFSLTIKWYKQQQTVCFSWSMFRKASLMCSATNRQMFVFFSIWWSSTSP